MAIQIETNGHVYATATGVIPVKWVEVNTTLLGDNTIVAAVAGKKIRVSAISLQAMLAVTLTVKSNPGNTKIGATALVANARMDLNVHPGFWVETNVGEALIFNVSVIGGVQGIINYIEVN